MAREENPARVWIDRIETALRVARPGEVVNKAQLASMLGVSPNHLMDKLIKSDPDVPILKGGSEGVAYQFDAVTVLEYLNSRMLAKELDQRAKASRIAELTGTQAALGKSANDAGQYDLGIMGVADLTKLLDFNVKLQRMQIEQGQLVWASEVSDFLITYNSTVQAAILGVEQKIDPLGQLPVDVRQDLHDELRSLLVDVQDKVERFLRRNEVEAVKRTAKRS